MHKRQVTRSSATGAGGTQFVGPLGRRVKTPPHPRWRRLGWCAILLSLVLCLLFCFFFDQNKMDDLVAAPLIEITERDVLILFSEAATVDEKASVSTMTQLFNSATRVAVSYGRLLEQMIALEEAEVMHEPVDTKHFDQIGHALMYVADVGYAKLKGMLLGEAGADLALAPTSILRTVFGWMLSDLYLYTSILPEYFLMKDNATSHGISLLRSISLLSLSNRVLSAAAAGASDDEPISDGEANSRSPRLTRREAAASFDLFNWSDTVCRKVAGGGRLPPLIKFCDSSFSSWVAVHTRMTASYEELIVLFPRYAPLRLHYAMEYTFWGPAILTSKANGRRALGADSAGEENVKMLTVVHNNRIADLSKYHFVEPIYEPLLALLEAYLFPSELWQENQGVVLTKILVGFGSCTKLKAELDSLSRWPGDAFRNEIRPRLLSDDHFWKLMTKIRTLRGGYNTKTKAFWDCL